MIVKLIFLAILIIIILYFLAIMPKLKPNPDSAKLNGWLYAHRGFHDNKSDAPENSLRAFRLAVEKGYGIELDVQITKDLLPIVFHDYNLRRACHTDLEVSKMTYEEMKGYHLYTSQETIPTLQEVLDEVNGKVPLIIELKIPWKAGVLCNVVSQILQEYKGIYCIESFNPFGLIWYRKHCPHVVRGQLATDFRKDKINGSRFQYFILKHLLINFYTKPDFIAYHHVYRRGLSFTLCRLLFRTKPIAWTIQSQEDLEKCQAYFELFIFDSFVPKSE